MLQAASKRCSQCPATGQGSSCSAMKKEEEEEQQQRRSTRLCLRNLLMINANCKSQRTIHPLPPVAN